MKKTLPWPAKMIAKMVLARLPVDYRLWKRLGLFEHGCMDRPQYAVAVVMSHMEKAGIARRTGGFVALEIGPGDSLFSGLIAHALGASRTYLVDVGRFATMRMDDYRAMERYLGEQRLSVPDRSRARSMDDLLQGYGICYFTEGVGSFESLPDASVDFVWSHATLEHIRRAQFPELARQIRRVLRADGVGSHQVDLQDHLGGALNNLRFPRHLWESELMARSGFYTNRIGYSEMLEIFRSAGLEVEIIDVNRWSSLPTPRRRMVAEFCGRPEEDLLVRGFHMLMRPAGVRVGGA